MRVFHTSFSRWAFTCVWVTIGLLSTPGPFSVFWPISIMLGSEWSRFFHRFLIVLIPFPILWGPFQVLQLQMVSLSPKCSTLFLVLWQELVYISLLLSSLCDPLQRQNPLDKTFFFPFNLHYVWSSGWIRWSVCISESSRVLCITFSGVDCTYTYGQNLVFCTIPSESPFPLNRA